MKARKKFCQLVLTLIKERPQDIVFFAGAGISLSPPTSLPLANAVKLEVLKQISNNTPSTKLGKFYKEHRVEIGDLINNIFMESVFEIIRIRSRELDDKVLFEMIAETFEAGTPNTYHLLLAQLIQDGCSAVTTNFDMLIEKASSDPIITERNRATLCTSDTDRVLHIHGSITAPMSIITTLTQVGRGLPEDLGNALKDVLKNKVVVFIGWSDNDIDITPALFMAKMERVYWLKHNASRDQVQTADDIRSSDDIVDKLVSQFNGLKYTGNTRDVVHDLWKDLWGVVPLKRGRAHNWKKPIKRLSQLNEWDRAFILAEVLERIDGTKALMHKLIGRLQDLVRRPSRSGQVLSRDILAELYCKKSVCERIIGRFEDAVRSAKRGKEVLDQEEHLSWLVELNNDIASAYNDWAYQEKNVEMHGDAIAIFEQNIELINERLEREINLAIRTLLLLDKAQVHTNLGSTYSALYETARAHSQSQDILLPYLESAINHYEAGIRIHEDIAKEELQQELVFYNNTKLGDLYNNIANVLCTLDRKTEGKRAFRLCLESKKNAGDIIGRKRALGDYMSWFSKENDLHIDDEIFIENRILRNVLKEAAVSSTHLLYYKRRLVEEERRGH